MGWKTPIVYPNSNVTLIRNDCCFVEWSAVFAVLENVIHSSRMIWLHKNLFIEKQIALRLFSVYFVIYQNKFRRCGRNLIRLIFLFTKVLIFFQHQCYPLQISSLRQPHTDRDVVPTFDSNAGSIQPVWSSACPLDSFGWFFMKSLKGSEKGSFVWDQTLQTNGCSIKTTPHVTLPSLS